MSVEDDDTLAAERDPFGALSSELRAVLGPDGALRAPSRSWGRRLGLPNQELEGRLLADLVHDEDRGAVVDLLSELAAGREVRGVEVRLRGRHADAGELWVRCHASPDEDDPLGYLVAEDVTDQVCRRREQAELAATKALLEEAQQLARLGHFEADLETSLVEWSPMVYEIFGFDPDASAPLRRGINKLVHPDDRDTARTVAEALRSEGHSSVDLRIIRPDGQVRSIRQVARVMPHAGGSPTRVVGTVQDLTELRATEAALRESQEQLERVLAATRDGWWELRFDGRPSFYSDRWWELCGYSPGELPADPEPWRQLTHPDALPAFEAAVAEVLASGDRTFVLPSAGLHRDGRRIPMVVRGLIDYDEDGTPIRASGATSDVSEAQEADLAKERFISTVSHELRTPLTAIGGAVELLERGVAGPVPPRARQLLEIAQRNTRRLRLLIDDLLDLERRPSVEQAFELAPHPLGELLARAVADNQPYADGHDVRLVLRPLDEELRVTVEPTRIEQVLANLLSNAAKYAPAGSEVEVGVRPSPVAADRARIEVVDHGPGVPPGLQERVFDRFVQADPDDRRSRGGTGLGLAISREIVQRHDGAIGVDSQPGRTCFWFDLPVSQTAG